MSSLRLDYLSPLPPVKSGISDYSVDLLPYLRERADVRVLELTGAEVAKEVAERFFPLPIAEVWPERGGAQEDDDQRYPLYQMGNNTYHEEIYALAMERPGFLTLHDIWLHHLLMERTLAKADLPSYVEALQADHDWIGGAASLPPRWGAYGKAAAFSLPAHRSLLARQLGVLVHSEWAAERVRESLAEDGAEPRVRAVPMPMPIPDADPNRKVAAAEFRQELGLPLSAPVLGSFGFQTPIKRTDVAIRCLAEPGLEKVHLLIGGDLSSDPTSGPDLRELARDLGVEERVRITGFLPAEQFPIAITACDLCVNLRYPTAGETSASLLRILALGRGAVVSEYAQFADLADEDKGVLAAPLDSVSPAGEVRALARRLTELFSNRNRVKQLGEAARANVAAAHDPARSADAMMTALEEMLEEAKVMAASRAAADSQPDEGLSLARRKPEPRPSSLTWGSLPYRIEVSGSQAPWPAGERRRLSITVTNLSFARWLAADRGPGGVALEVQLLQQEGGLIDLRADEPWLPLPVDIEPGDRHVFEVAIRRPPGTSRLRIAPQVIGGAGLGRSGGRPYEAMLL